MPEPEALSLADILNLEEIFEMDIDISPEHIIKKFEEDPRIKKVIYNSSENKFYVTFVDGETTYFKIFFPQKNNNA